MKTPLMVGCDPECKNRQTVVELAEVANAARISFDIYASLRKVGPREIRKGWKALQDTYGGLGTVQAVGEHCVQACALERFADDYDRLVENGVQFGNLTEAVISSCKKEQ